eukprot:1861114-Amphidinium_carterae.1
MSIEWRVGGHTGDSSSELLFFDEPRVEPHRLQQADETLQEFKLHLGCAELLPRCSLANTARPLAGVAVEDPSIGTPRPFEVVTLCAKLRGDREANCQDNMSVDAHSLG